jgi:hypothetical protein
MTKKAYNNIFSIFTIFTASLVFAFFVFSLSRFDFFKDFNKDAYAAVAEFYYVSQDGAGLHNGTVGNEWSVVEFNNPANWSNTDGDPIRIDPGDTVYFSNIVTITTQIKPPEGNSGDSSSGGYITLDGWQGGNCNPVAVGDCANAVVVDRPSSFGQDNYCFHLIDNNYFVIQDFKCVDSYGGILTRGSSNSSDPDSEELIIRRNYFYDSAPTVAEFIAIRLTTFDTSGNNNSYNNVTIGGANGDGNLVVSESSENAGYIDNRRLILANYCNDLLVSHNLAYFNSIPRYGANGSIFQLLHSDRVLLEYNYFYNAPRYCVQLAQGGDSQIIRFNKFTNCQAGIAATAENLTWQENVYIYGNLFYDIYGGIVLSRNYRGFHIWSNVFNNITLEPGETIYNEAITVTNGVGYTPNDVYIYNNTIARSAQNSSFKYDSGLYIEGNNYQDVYVKNNIFYYNNSNANDRQVSVVNSGSLEELEHNTYASDNDVVLYYSGNDRNFDYMQANGWENEVPAGEEIHNLLTTPIFNDATNYDYTLDGSHVDNGSDDFSRCFFVVIQGVIRHICYSDALSPSTDWTVTPPDVRTANQEYNGSGWERGAYVYSDSTAQNVNGFAWNGADTNSGIGWISFNSTDCDLNNDGSFGDVGAPAGCPAAGPTAFVYGVDFDPGTGNFSGYAWNNQVGWISFDRNDPNTGDPPNSPTDDPGAGSGPIAQYSSVDDKVYGWAKILSMGDEGWIRFDHGQDTNNEELRIDLATGDFSGWAWNGNDDDPTTTEGNWETGIGWISFNCNSYNAGGCAFPYKVSINPVTVNTAPSVQNPSSALDENRMCEYYDPNNSPLMHYRLAWDFTDADSGDYQTKFDIEIDDNIDGDFSTPYFSDTGGGNEYYLFTQFNPAHFINFNTSYEWRVRVYDKNNEPSAWLEVTGANIEVIVTPDHEYPVPAFYWSPNQINEGTPSKFIGSDGVKDLSKYYSIPGVSNNCDLDPAPVNCTYTWSVAPDPSVVNYDTGNDLASPFITFNEKSENFSVNLEVRDANGYSCSTSTEISTYLPLPVWIEN